MSCHEGTAPARAGIYFCWDFHFCLFEGWEGCVHCLSLRLTNQKLHCTWEKTKGWSWDSTHAQRHPHPTQCHLLLLHLERCALHTTSSLSFQDGNLLERLGWLREAQEQGRGPRSELFAWDLWAGPWTGFSAQPQPRATPPPSL